MKVLHLSYSDSAGGASKAAFRLHNALRRRGVDSHMLVTQRRTSDPDVSELGRVGRFFQRVRSFAVSHLPSRQSNGAAPPVTPAIFPSFLPKKINANDYDVVHLHWIGGEFLSVEDIGRVRAPIVWTLHDMWAFCGAEHYVDHDRWREGYSRENRDPRESGFDMNSWVWKRKKTAWARRFQIVTPSNWLAECASSSSLLGEMNVFRIPNALDTVTWAPTDRIQARAALGITDDAPLILFGAVNATSDPRKGFDLLAEALRLLSESIPNLHLAVFGDNNGQGLIPPSIDVNYLGHLSDECDLQRVYGASDAFVIPSRLDNLPNTGLEALSCGTPVVGFRIGGMPDIVDHLRNGYLAEPFDAEDLATGIRWVLKATTSDDTSNQGATVLPHIRSLAREKAVQSFGENGVVDRYVQVYREAMCFESPTSGTGARKEDSS